jgi:CheY-like chemotaxis protein
MSDAATHMKKILLVDDEPQIVELFSTLLRESGYRAVTAANGAEALGLYLYARFNEPFDLMVLDVSMPRIDGLQVLETVRKDEAARGIACAEGLPIIILTAYKSTCMLSFNLGCDDYVLKPVQPETLLDKIRLKIR